ncbi:MAG: Gfo/Idh/MocA family oxidoreductase [Phycisphaerae bacterium]|jgi:predicted dehydrogenase|nr:Gfo/Idh/MocA family oxidoreductase [Phycisphaerae bacterium]
MKKANTNITRRSFLAGSAAAIVLPTVIPGSALGKDGKTPASDRIGTGHIGVGGRGSGHVGGFLGRSDAQVLAVADPYKSKGASNVARINKKYKGAKAYQDFRELLARDDIDAVVVASPENWHALHSIHAVKAGKDVYCEKAISLTIAEGRAMCKAVRRYGKILQVGTQQRSDARFRLACQLVRNGYLGKVHTVKVGVPGGRQLPIMPAKKAPDDIDYKMWLGPAPWSPYTDKKCSFNWYFMQDYCAGWIQSWGVHHCDIALWGLPQLGKGKIKASGTATFPTEGPANTSITWNTKITAEDGTVMSFCSNKEAGHPQGVRFEGDKGWVHVRRGAIKASSPALLQTVFKPSDEKLYVSTNHHNNFFDCIRTRRDPAAPIEAGHRATAISLVADVATRLKREVQFDWDKEQYIKDDAADKMLTRSMTAPWRI